MTTTLPIGLPSWIIKDGNYADFKVGRACSFALEFYAPEPLKKLSGARLEPRHVYTGDAQFAVVGKVIHNGDDWWVVDFGIPAYEERLPAKSYEPNTLVEGSVYIGVDSFSYFERLSRTANAPALIFDWMVERIEIQTAPFIQQGERRLIRDPEKMGWRDLDETNAWGDDYGFAEYILHCTRLNERPRHSLNR